MERVTAVSVIYRACLVLAFFATIGHAKEDSYRLPNGTIPTHYILRLDTAIDQNVFNYTGNVKITMYVLETTTRLVLHSTHNIITKVQLRDKNGLQVQVTNFSLEIDRQFLVIETATLVHARNGPHTLEIDYTNSVDRADMVGFYKSSYLGENDTVRNIGVTHFEPIGARSAFPCFDEPDIKATFELHISCGSKYHVRSNTPVRTVQRLPGGKQLYSFHQTPRMQTYVLAWLISDFVSERKVLDGLTVATWAKPSSAHLLAYSVNASVRYIRAMEEYFAERYSLPKIDNIAIPQRDLHSLAMENWGLVTYQENAILYNPQTEGIEKQRKLVNLIAHEYTHQFFGNLLTPQWWSYLWLKEGFAHFYSYHLADNSHPELKLRKRFITESLFSAFLLDSLPIVPPMTRYVEKPKDIRGLYGHVVYSKAACVIRMMNYAMGERIFRDGIRHYIQQNKRHGIVTENDLFDSLELVAKKEYVLPKNLTMHEVFRSWSHQAGYPVVSVRRDGDTYFFTQQRFVLDDGGHERFNSSWWIPISFSSISNTLYRRLAAFWMAPNVSQVSYTIKTAPNEVVVFNPQSTGYYLIAYDEPLLRGIIRQLTTNHTAIVPEARARLIGDTLLLAHTPGTNFDIVLELLHYLRHEADILPWTMAYKNLRYIQSMLRTNEKASRLLQSFVEAIVTPVLSRHEEHQRSNDSDDSLMDELCSIVRELASDVHEAFKNVSQSILHTTTHNPNTALNGTGLRNAITPIRSYAHFLFQLRESDHPKELHRLIVVSKVSPRVLLESIRKELSQNPRESADHTSISKILITMSRYTMEPEEERLLTAVASTHDAEIVPEIERQRMINRRWIARNAQPLTDALTRFFLRKA